MKTISAAELKRRLRSNEEIALLDMREEVDFYKSHLLFAANVPLSRLEQMIGDLIPRANAPIVTCDAGEGLAQRAAERLAWLGYTDVAVLQDGNAGWEKAGGILFAGANVPSKAFGEFVEHEYGTPHITAEDLNRKLRQGEKMVILDSRPFEEFQIMSIPGGLDCPGAELPYRAREAVPDADTLIVVNCAGRTRSIIGTQSLINNGIGNKVAALKDGTMGWELAGLAVARKSDKRAPAASPAGIATARAGAKSVAERAGVRMIDPTGLDRFRAERQQRSLYVLDVRMPEEYESGHLEDAIPAFGGQLVQATDRYIAVRGARLVLVDDTEVRALMTASWLRQMGWDDVFVLAGGIDGQKLVTGKRRAQMLGLDRIAPMTLDPAKAQRILNQGEAALIDLADPRRFKAEHIAGALYAVRSKLPEGLERIPGERLLIFTSSDGRFAALAAAEIAELTGRKTAAIAGGTAAWKKAGLPLNEGDADLLHPRIETWSPYDEAHRTRQSMLDYLSWEIDLYERIKKDGDTRFRMLAAG